MFTFELRSVQPAPQLESFLEPGYVKPQRDSFLNLNPHQSTDGWTQDQPPDLSRSIFKPTSTPTDGIPYIQGKIRARAKVLWGPIDPNLSPTLLSLLGVNQEQVQAVGFTRLNRKNSPTKIYLQGDVDLGRMARFNPKRVTGIHGTPEVMITIPLLNNRTRQPEQDTSTSQLLQLSRAITGIPSRAA